MKKFLLLTVIVFIMLPTYALAQGGGNGHPPTREEEQIVDYLWGRIDCSLYSPHDFWFETIGNGVLITQTHFDKDGNVVRTLRHGKIEWTLTRLDTGQTAWMINHPGNEMTTADEYRASGYFHGWHVPGEGGETIYPWMGHFVIDLETGEWTHEAGRDYWTFDSVDDFHTDTCEWLASWGG